MTPLQEHVARLVEGYEDADGRRVSGRKLSSRIGKSRNHLSQIVNDGLVPSGEVLLKLADTVGLNKDERDQLILDGIRTKITLRARDAFWLEHVLDLHDTIKERVTYYEIFVESVGMKDRFGAWLAEQEAAKEAQKKKDEKSKDSSSSSSSSSAPADETGTEED